MLYGEIGDHGPLDYALDQEYWIRGLSFKFHDSNIGGWPQLKGASMKMKIRFVAWLLVFALAQPGFGQDSAGEFNQAFQKALGAKDFDEALKLIEQDTAAPLGMKINRRAQIASFLMQANRKDEAMVQFEKAAGDAIQAAQEGKISNQEMQGTVMLATAMTRTIDAKKSSAWVSRAVEIVQSKLTDTELTPDHRILIDLLRMKMQFAETSQAESHKATLSECIAKCEELFSKQSTNPPKAATMLGIWGVQLQIADAQQSEETYSKATKLAESMIRETANANLVSNYLAIVSSYIGKSARNAPDRASVALDSAKSFLKSINSEDKNVNQVIEGFLKNSKNIERTIEGAKRLLTMVGKPAPAIDPMEWINGEPLSKLSDIEGRVVLIDFWAVWCGPCIATFPHLKHLDAEYSKQGLTILGVTRQYNMRWDDDKDTYTRSDTPVELSDEMQMLEKFIAKHELTHRTMVTPEKSEMQSQYAVTGIPHAVLIDKKGIVRLVKVGSGSQNAEEIESTIKQLLAE